MKKTLKIVELFFLFLPSKWKLDYFPLWCQKFPAELIHLQSLAPAWKWRRERGLRNTPRGEPSGEVQLFENTAGGVEIDNSRGIKSVTHRGLEANRRGRFTFIYLQRHQKSPTMETRRRRMERHSAPERRWREECPTIAGNERSKRGEKIKPDTLTIPGTKHFNASNISELRRHARRVFKLSERPRSSK